MSCNGTTQNGNHGDDHSTSSPGRAVMWTMPRTTSTVVMRSMSRIPETEIWHEPFAWWFTAARCLNFFTGQSLPDEYAGNEAVYKDAAHYLGATFFSTWNAQKLSPCNIKRSLEESKSKFVFVKDHSMGWLDESVIRAHLPIGYHHAFLIRHPLLMYSSLKKADYRNYSTCEMSSEIISVEETDASAYDLRKHVEIIDPLDYYKRHHSLWRFIRENAYPNPVVIDSSDLLAKPAEMLTKYCEAIDFPYSDAMLNLDVPHEDMKRWKWSADDRVHNRTYTNVSHESTGFKPSRALQPRDQYPEDVIEIADLAMPYYEEMYECRLKA